MKTTKCFCFGFAAVLISGFLVFTPSASAATTFPVDTAGIGAYVKLNSFTLENFENAKQKLFDSVESAGDTYVIGLKQYDAGDGDHNEINYHVYLGTNGWLAVYLLKTEAPSRVANWRSGAGLGETMLKLAIEDSLNKMGATAAESIKYYDFSHPEANRMTLARESLSQYDLISYNDFNIYVPGTLYQASWAMLCDSAFINAGATSATLFLDGNAAGTITANPLVYDNYNQSSFGENRDHKIKLERRSGYGYRVDAVTALIYKI